MTLTNRIKSKCPCYKITVTNETVKRLGMFFFLFCVCFAIVFKPSSTLFYTKLNRKHQKLFYCRPTLTYPRTPPHGMLIVNDRLMKSGILSDSQRQRRPATKQANLDQTRPTLRLNRPFPSNAGQWRRRSGNHHRWSIKHRPCASFMC